MDAKSTLGDAFKVVPEKIKSKTWELESWEGNLVQSAPVHAWYPMHAWRRSH